MLSKSGRICFALEEQGRQRVCFGSSNLFTHIQKKHQKKLLGGWLEAQGQEGEDALVLFKVSAAAQLPIRCAQAWPRVQGGTMNPLGP